MKTRVTWQKREVSKDRKIWGYLLSGDGKKNKDKKGQHLEGSKQGRRPVAVHGKKKVVLSKRTRTKKSETRQRKS